MLDYTNKYKLEMRLLITLLHYCQSTSFTNNVTQLHHDTHVPQITNIWRQNYLAIVLLPGDQRRGELVQCVTV